MYEYNKSVKKAEQDGNAKKKKEKEQQEGAEMRLVRRIVENRKRNEEAEETKTKAAEG